MEELESDESLKVFLTDTFDAKSHCNLVLQTEIVSEYLTKLNNTLQTVESNLHEQVEQRYGDLLTQAVSVEALEDLLETMRLRVNGLMLAISRVKERNGQLVSTFQRESKRLSDLLSVCNLLRRVSRIQVIGKQLTTSMSTSTGPTNDVTKVAKNVSELEQLFGDSVMLKLDVVKPQWQLLQEAKLKATTTASSLLKQGLEQNKQLSLATALQVYYWLGTLAEKVNELYSASIKRVTNNLKDCFDMASLVGSGTHGPGRAAIPIPGSSQTFRAELWTRLESFCSLVGSETAKLYSLQSIMERKRDPVHNVLFIDEVAGNFNGTIVASFWRRITEVVVPAQMELVVGGSSMFRAMLESEYPKLLQIFISMYEKKLKKLFDANTADSVDANLDEPTSRRDVDDDEEDGGEMAATKSTDQFDAERLLRDSLKCLDAIYVKRSYTRICDPINLIFHESAGDEVHVASTEEIRNLIRTMIEELRVAVVDDELCEIVSKNVSNALKLFASRTEDLYDLESGDATQVIGPLTETQRRNVNVANSVLSCYQQLVKELLANGMLVPASARQSNAKITGQFQLSRAATEWIFEALDVFQKQLSTAMEPLVGSICDSVEAIILTMHNENMVQQKQCSLYMKELQRFCARLPTDYLDHWQARVVVGEAAMKISGRAVELFLTHCALVRPVDETVRMRLSADCAQMECVVEALLSTCSPLAGSSDGTAVAGRPADLGLPYKQLKMFKQLLFQTTEHIKSWSAVGQILPHSLVLHHLFSRCQNQLLKSPHQASGWSVARYSQWLDDHPSESDRIKMIRSAVDLYYEQVVRRSETTFDSVYPVLVSLLEAAERDGTTA